MRPSSAAVCIAQVACIEIPSKEWPELIGVLTTNVTALGSTEMMKESSLETIGYICQDIVSPRPISTATTADHPLTLNQLNRREPTHPIFTSH